MFLSNSSLFSVVKAQVKFKINAYNGLIYSLIILQVLGILLGGNAGSSGTSINSTTISLNTSTNDVSFILVSLLAISVGNLLTTKAYRYDDFSFVATRLSSNIANFIVLFIFSCFAGVTTYFSGYVMRLILHFKSTSEFVDSSSIFNNPSSFLLTIVAIITMLWLFSSIGYIAGILFQMHKLFFFGAVVIVVMLLMTGTWIRISESIFVENGSLLILIMKVIIITILLLATSTAISNRLGVRT
ncbi:hypothetical protein SAMN05518871_107248 [Psychrobacillus sp. OK028]|uniref:hypothetical protein n=1 Tax=Psychrobacillus sp. OK028 TaxID=1884359 RepID=UPI000883BF26|nr:hypothetical protein [Psychrobacillus sp. OK028]SDN80431.1 hypothetical protein SAMN05518871_107248 [Psychrobacillus sp. OK028]